MLGIPKDGYSTPAVPWDVIATSVTFNKEAGWIFSGYHLIWSYFFSRFFKFSIQRGLESKLVKYNDSNNFDHLEALLHKSSNIPEYIEEWRIDKFDGNKVRESPFLTEMFSSAINKINGLKKGEYQFDNKID